MKSECPDRPLGPPQCHSCQTYGHTCSHCRLPPHCVQFESNRFANNCTKTREEPAKCANCGGNHTANNKGCQTFKDTLNRNKDKAEKKNQKIIRSNIFCTVCAQIINVLVANSNQKPTYAKTTANTPPVNQPFRVIN